MSISDIAYLPYLNGKNADIRIWDQYLRDQNLQYAKLLIWLLRKKIGCEMKPNQGRNIKKGIIFEIVVLFIICLFILIYVNMHVNTMIICLKQQLWFIFRMFGLFLWLLCLASTTVCFWFFSFSLCLDGLCVIACHFVCASSFPVVLLLQCAFWMETIAHWA